MKSGISLLALAALAPLPMVFGDYGTGMLVGLALRPRQ